MHWSIRTVHSYEYECNHDFSSAGYSQSNGQAERKIQHIKKVLAKCVNECSDFNFALLAYRTTSLSDNLLSPAYILMNRNLRTKLPGIKLDHKNYSEIRDVLLARQRMVKKYYDKRAKNPREMFDEGAIIRYRDSGTDKNWKPGKITSVRSPENRSYQLVNEQGNIITRNNKLLIKDKTRSDMVFDTIDYLPDVQGRAPAQTPKCQTHVRPSPSDSVEDQSPDQPPTPPRRSTRTRKQTKLYGNPVAH